MVVSEELSNRQDSKTLEEVTIEKGPPFPQKSLQMGQKHNQVNPSGGCPALVAEEKKRWFLEGPFTLLCKMQG